MARHAVESEVAGSVWKVEVAVGATVAKGDVLIILESMKMEIPVESPASGVIEEILVLPEEQVAEEQVLIVVRS
ncbi:MAG: biotin/lipoyl-binding protein [Gammaproteobacteria bacterium]|nr:biotin/lipoyl-binding protein [Gammaproteobacteria bacterium]